MDPQQVAVYTRTYNQVSDNGLLCEIYYDVVFEIMKETGRLFVYSGAPGSERQTVAVYNTGEWVKVLYVDRLNALNAKTASPEPNYGPTERNYGFQNILINGAG